MRLVTPKVVLVSLKAYKTFSLSCSKIISISIIIYLEKFVCPSVCLSFLVNLTIHFSKGPSIGGFSDDPVIRDGCTYTCKEDEGCRTEYSSGSMGSCFSKFFGGMCFGTPPQCQDCNQVVDCSRGNSVVKQTMGNFSSLIRNGEQWLCI